MPPIVIARACGQDADDGRVGNQLPVLFVDVQTQLFGGITKLASVVLPEMELLVLLPEKATLRLTFATACRRSLPAAARSRCARFTSPMRPCCGRLLHSPGQLHERAGRRQPPRTLPSRCPRRPVRNQSTPAPPDTRLHRRHQTLSPFTLGRTSAPRRSCAERDGSSCFEPGPCPACPTPTRLSDRRVDVDTGDSYHRR